jgi:hypothetical protein
LRRAEADVGIPASIVGSYTGDAAEFSRSLAGQPWLLLAAAVTIYIVLGILYESFIHPLTILSTLPSAGVGALLALMLVGHDLSVVALIGIILLMGIVKKNAILMIDFALDAERVDGMAPRDAIVKAAMLRFRPIMMTTLAALFGALPLALENGTGSELRFPLGITIVGGLLLSQLADALHHAGDLSCPRAIKEQGVSPPRHHGAGGVAAHEHLLPVHSKACRHGADGDRICFSRVSLPTSTCPSPACLQSTFQPSAFPQAGRGQTRRRWPPLSRPRSNGGLARSPGLRR